MEYRDMPEPLPLRKVPGVAVPRRLFARFVVFAATFAVLYVAAAALGLLSV